MCNTKLGKIKLPDSMFDEMARYVLIDADNELGFMIFKCKNIQEEREIIEKFAKEKST
jgi:hypothetical protein